MKPFFAFTDECGNYNKKRSKKFLKAHPFYVRATVLVSLDDYLILEKYVDETKELLGVSPNHEIKWSHLGNAFKGKTELVPCGLSTEQLLQYYNTLLSKVCQLPTLKVIYTLTQNDIMRPIDEIAFLKMHLQNALQRIQREMKDNGYAIIIADDLDSKTKALKEAIHRLTLDGDFVSYSNIKKCLFVDYSNQCQGLQVADIFAGVFTATLKYIAAQKSERHKYVHGYNIFINYGYSKVRYSSRYPDDFCIYGRGIREVPNDAGTDIAKEISSLVSTKLTEDFIREIRTNLPPL